MLAEALHILERMPLEQLEPTIRKHAAVEAMRRAYRDRIRSRAGGPVVFLYLRGRRDTLAGRMRQREGHFMPAALLDSQLATLEEPGADEAVVIADIEEPLDRIVATLIAGTRRGAGPKMPGG